MRDEILGQLKAALPVDGACSPARRDGGARLRRLRRRPPRARARPRRTESRDRRRARPALPPDEEALRRRRRHRAVQGISAHGFRRARRGDGRPHAADDPRRDQAGDVHLRLPRDRRASRPRSSRCAASSTSIMALEGKDRVLSISIAHCFHYGDVPECGARILVLTDDAKPHGDRLAEEIGRELIALREQAAPPIFRRRRDRCGAGASRRPDGDRGHDRQCRRRRALGQHHLHSPPDRARRAGRGRRADLGPDGGAPRFDAGEGARVPVPLRRQDRARPPARRSMPKSRSSAACANAHRPSAGATVRSAMRPRSAWAASRSC